MSQTSSIFTFNPILDNDDIIRVGGRLLNSNYSYDRKHPILIPVNCNFTTVYLNYVHLRYFHSSPSFMITFVNQKFRFVGGLRRAVKKVYRACPTCRKFSNETMEQIIGPLPKDRITVTRPFSITGVDFAGPFILKPVGHRSKVRFKSYIAVFVCYCTRAVHLETVSDLTAAAFLATLKRFAARRGCPNTIYSDNATNFTGTSNLLSDTNVLKYSNENRINWKFNPPRAPHHGGMFEAAVRIMKRHLKKTIGDQILTFEELTTLSAEVEAIMNSRPLCLRDGGDDIDDYLTPGHFITGTHLLVTPEEDNLRLKLPDRWRLIQNLKSSFWKKWRNDYLNTFYKSNKWNRQRDNVAIKDIVIVKDDNLPPTRYQLGRIVHVRPGPDGKVRVAEVKTRCGHILRPITKLIPFLPQSGAECL